MEDDKKIDLQPEEGSLQNEEEEASFVDDSSIEDASGEPAEDGVESSDEYYDESSDYADEEDFVEEDWDAYDDEYEEGESESGSPPAKKKGKLNRNFVAVIGAVGFMVIYMGMSGGGGQDVPQQDVSLQVGIPQDDSLAQSTISPANIHNFKDMEGDVKRPEKTAAPLSPGFLNDPEAFDEVEKIRDEVVFEGFDYEEDFSESQVVSEQLPMPAAMATQAESLEKEQFLTPMLVEDDVSSVGSLPDLSQADDVVKVSASVAVPFSDDVDINEKINLLFERMDSIEAQLSSLEEDSVVSGDIEDMRKVIRNLEHNDGAALSVKIKRPDRPSESAVKKDISKSAEPVRWVLKSAQPGRAMVSRKGQVDTRVVDVGDSLTGLGQITAIHHENNRWVVRGTKGSISQ